MRPHLPHLLASLLAASLLWPASVQAEADALVRQALSLTKQGGAKEAFAMLAAQEVSRAGDPDFDTVLGIAANEIGEYTRAIFALERVLAVQPGNARARAELGRALFAVGDTKAARALFEQTKSQGIPVEAASTIDQFLQAIERVDAEGKSSWRGHLEASIGRDSNVNSAPADPSVAVPAFGPSAILTLNPAGVKTSSSFAALGGGLSGRYVVDPRWSLIGNVSGNFRRNSGRADAFDTDLIDLNGGASYRVERHEFSLAGQFETQSIDGARARDQAGLVGEWMYRFDAFRQFGAYAQLSRLRYPQQGIRDADRRVLGASYAHLFRTGLLVYAGLYAGEESERAAGVPQLGHKLSGLRTGVQQPLSDRLAAFASLSHENRRFGGTDPLFLVVRHDRQTHLNLGLSWLAAKAWRITPQLAITQARSNLVIADYGRRVFAVTVRHDF